MANPTQEIHTNDVKDASVEKVDMKLEVVIIPSRMWIAPGHSTRSSGGGWTSRRPVWSS